MVYFVLKYLHIIGAAVLLGTGSGIAFFMLLAHLSVNVFVIAGVARIVVLADFLFTATAVIAQPLTGFALIWYLGYPITEHWIVLSLLLYVLTGMFWLPVVWMQIQLQRLAAEAAANRSPLPKRYHQLFRLWFAFGFPAFGAVLGIFWLMIARPSVIW